MNSVSIPPPDKAERISEESMTLIKVVIDSLTNNNQMLDLNDVMNQFKTDSYFTSDDLEKFKPVIIEYVNLKNNESEVIYTYKYCFASIIYFYFIEY